MLFAKRLFLLIFVAAAPVALTWLSYVGVTLLLARTNRYIDPEILQIAAIAEFAAFFFITVLEAKAHWLARPSL